MKIVFLGTPEFAVPVLEALINSKHKVLAVVSQKDREKDRKGNILATPVKKCALENNLKVLQYDKVSIEGLEEIRLLGADAFVTCAFGQLLTQPFLDLAKMGVYNVHASLLPKYRGSSPIQSAILNGDNKTGITIMKTDIGMDTGDIMLKSEIEITNTTTSESLSNDLSYLGANLIVEALDLLESGQAKFVIQDNNLATHTKKILKTDGVINFSKSAFLVLRQINAFNPWPCAYAFYKEDNLKIYRAEIIKSADFDNYKAGQVCLSDNKLIIKCGDDAISILSLQAPAKKRMNVADFLRGYKIENGYIFQ